MDTCRVCASPEKLLPLQARYKNRICRPCKSAQQRKTDQSPGGKLNRRNGQIRRRYGMSPADYDARLAAQHGTCAICEKATANKLHVDHDHSSGRVRGLLCPLCNTVLGKMNDSPVLLRKAAAYLEDE